MGTEVLTLRSSSVTRGQRLYVRLCDGQAFLDGLGFKGWTMIPVSGCWMLTAVDRFASPRLFFEVVPHDWYQLLMQNGSVG